MLEETEIESGQHWVELWHSHRIIHRIDNWTLGLFSLCFVFFVHNPRNNSSNRTYNIEIYLCLVLCRCLLCTFPHLLIFLRLSVSMWVHQSCIAFNANATHTQTSFSYYRNGCYSSNSLYFSKSIAVSFFLPVSCENKFSGLIFGRAAQKREGHGKKTCK